MNKIKSIFKQGRVYFLGTQAAQAITLVAAILSRRFLGPTQMGIWSTLQVLVDYSKYSTAGLLDATAREIPYQIGKSNPVKADEVKNLAFSFVAATSSVIVISIFVFAFLMRGRFQNEVTYGLCLVGGVIFLQRFNNLLIGLLRAFKQFHVEAHMMVASAVVNALLVGTLSYYFKIYGFIWAMIFSFTFNIAYLLLAYKFRLRWYFDWKTLKPLLQYGFPLLILGVLAAVLKSLDRILIAKYLGFEKLGMYSIALMTCSYMGNFSIAIGIVLIPHFQEKFGLRDNPADLKIALIKSTKVFALGMPPLIYGAWLFTPYFVHWFLPQYSSGITAMRILVLNMFFMALTQPYQDSLITIKKHLTLIPFLAGAILIAAGLEYGVIRLGYDIQGVAAATTSAFFLLYTAIFWLSAGHFMKIAEAIKTYTYTLVCFLYLAGVLWFSSTFLSGANTAEIRHLSIQIPGYVLFMLPYVFALNRNFDLLKKNKQNGSATSTVA
ncbi:MAG: oligosaccharide flippase family protein [Candidatus Omnitrophica bacterium]|nr:oligosaccharide flippase family protein [Candidatus Omnitrophota bacterium]